MLVDMVNDTKADAVILCQMKFCEPEEFDYPIHLKKFNELGIQEPLRLKSSSRLTHSSRLLQESRL